MAVAVTVIIATYNWSAALRVSIASVLAQSHRDFELLVVGDCCTDDSAEVVQSIGDSRVRWHNLGLRHKSQSGPNNYGIGIASGSLIAYLGHDDVWHPDHLRSLVSKIGEADAELACGVSLMYGPPGSGVRFLSGIFPEGRYRRRDFVPPSSLMHRKSLIERIGPWGSPETLAAPVDCDFLVRAFEAGARLVSTERLTVFKFNASLRRDSYLRREVSEQRQMLSRLTADPARCVEEEWAGVLRAHREFRLREHVMPGRWTGPSGSEHRSNLRGRGLADPPAEELSAARRFALDDQHSTLDWHAVERSDEWGTFRWSGPSPAAMLVLPIRAPRHYAVRLRVLNWFGADLSNEVTLRIRGEPVKFTSRDMAPPSVVLEAEVSTLEAPEGPLRVELLAARLRCPYFETDGGSPDTRWLGICVNWIEVEPLPAGDGADDRT
jgi:GT2 family glycosyltransferase